jgi:hypothetical protein
MLIAVLLTRPLASLLSISWSVRRADFGFLKLTVGVQLIKPPCNDGSPVLPNDIASTVITPAVAKVNRERPGKLRAG